MVWSGLSTEPSLGDLRRGMVDPAMSRPSPDEFLPLPYFPWDSRPETLPLDVEEAATALFLDGGDVKAAASRLKVSTTQLKKIVRRSLCLQRLCDDLRPGHGP